MDKFDKGIKTVLNAMMSGFEKETREKYSEEISTITTLYKTDKSFLEKVEYAQHKFTDILSMVIDIPEQKNKYILKHILSGLYEHFIEQLMERREGAGCSADKSSFVKRMTLKALKENTNFSLYENYLEYEQIKEDKTRQAYWSPKTIPDTDTAMESFWDWYLLRMPKTGKKGAGCIAAEKE
jgi:hypothetical protein